MQVEKLNGNEEETGKGKQKMMEDDRDDEEVEQQADGREQFQLRPMACEQGLLNRADGSCHYSQGKTSVFVAVYGPVGVKGYKEKSDEATIEVVFKPQKGQSGAQEREWELFLRKALEAIVLSSFHPRTGINVIIQVISDDGGLLSTSINGVCIALLDAGINIRRQMVGVTAAFIEEVHQGEQEGQEEGRRYLVLDPSKEDQDRAVAVQHLAFEKREQGDKGDNQTLNEVLCCKSTGVMDEEEFFVCLEYCSVAADKVFEFVGESQRRKIKLEGKM